MTKVVVVGGGITGLCAAAACATAGLEVTVFEAGCFGDGFAPLTPIAPPAEEHLHVWRMSGHAFHLDREPVDLIADGEVVAQRHVADPRGLVGAWAAECRRRGVTLHTATPVLGLVRFGGKVSGVETHLASVAADEVVLAAGLSTPRFLAGTPGDVVLAVEQRAHLLIGPAADPLPGIVEVPGVLRLMQDPIRRLVVEALGPGDLLSALGARFADLAALPVLDAGVSRLTLPPDGQPIIRRPSWITGVTLLCAGGHPFDAAPRLAATLAAGLATGAWD